MQKRKRVKNFKETEISFAVENFCMRKVEQKVFCIVFKEDNSK